MPASLFFLFPEHFHSSVPKRTSHLYFVERSIGTQRFVVLWPLQANWPKKSRFILSTCAALLLTLWSSATQCSNWAGRWTLLHGHYSTASNLGYDKSAHSCPLNTHTHTHIYIDTHVNINIKAGVPKYISHFLNDNKKDNSACFLVVVLLHQNSSLS